MNNIPDFSKQEKKLILELKVDQFGHINIQTQLPLQQVCRVLISSAIDIIFQTFEQKRIKTL
jgi:hypothetical protein